MFLTMNRSDVPQSYSYPGATLFKLDLFVMIDSCSQCVKQSHLYLQIQPILTLAMAFKLGESQAISPAHKYRKHARGWMGQ